jgi:hypothetical protein
MSNVKSELDGSKSEPLLLESLGELYVPLPAGQARYGNELII